MPEELLTTTEEKRMYKISTKAPVISDDDERIIEGYFTTNDIDRHHEIVDPKAFKKTLKTYKKNPILLFGHEWWSLPIGKIIKIEIHEKGVWIQAKVSENADEIWGLIKEDILKTFSFGFRVIKYSMDKETEIRTITELELYEISLVSVPANSEAMIELAKSKGLPIKSFPPEKRKLVFEIEDNDEENKDKQLKTAGKPVNKENIMDPEVVMKSIVDLTEKVDAISTKNLSADDARKLITDINKSIDEIRDPKSGIAQSSDLEELKNKSKEDLENAMKTLEKKIEEKWVTPPKMPHDVSSVEQAKRLGNVDNFNAPENFKSAIINVNHEKAAARIGMLDRKHLVRELQEASDDLLITGAYLKMVGSGPEGALWGRDPQHLKTCKRYQKILTEFHKALDTETAGEGTEWLPTQMSATLLESIRLERTLGRRIPRFTQPTKSFVWPLRTSGATAYIVAEATSDSNADTFGLTTPGTSNITFTAKGMGAGVISSDEEIEDSIIPILPFIRQELSRALVDGEENALINGDDATTHQDTDVAALGASDIRKIFDGFRLDALANASQDASGTLTYALLIATLKKSGIYSLPQHNGFWLCGVDSYYKMMGLAQFTGYDVFAQMAVAGSGALPRALGHDVILSAYMRNDLDPNGVNAASDNIHTGIMFITPKGWMIGDRNIYTVEADRIIRTGQSILVAKQRLDMKKMVPSADTPAAMCYNITTA